MAKRSYGTPFKSKLRPHVDQIRKWRRAGFTWAAIADKLGGARVCDVCDELVPIHAAVPEETFPERSRTGDQRARCPKHKAR